MFSPGVAFLGDAAHERRKGDLEIDDQVGLDALGQDA